MSKKYRKLYERLSKEGYPRKQILDIIEIIAKTDASFKDDVSVTSPSWSNWSKVFKDD